MKDSSHSRTANNAAAENSSAKVGFAPPVAQKKSAADDLELSLDETTGSFFSPLQHREPPPENKTGMTNQLKSGLESLSGFDLSDVRVHYNSSKPAQLNALAYARGNDIHVGPGQDKHVAHEGWHVVQQRQGRVQPTTSEAGVAVNDNSSLETEADVMGSKAMQMQTTRPFAPAKNSYPGKGETLPLQRMPVAQLVISAVVELALPDKTQTTSNHCWAAAGWAVHEFHRGGSYGTEEDFVQGQASPSGKGTYKKNQLTDINQAIGSKSKDNLLSGSDDTGSYSKSTITAELNKDQPIVANIGGVHYVVICGKRKNDDMYQLKIMDPLSGSKTWQDTAGPSSSHISSVGGVDIAVLYYTKA